MMLKFSIRVLIVLGILSIVITSNPAYCKRERFKEEHLLEEMEIFKGSELRAWHVCYIDFLVRRDLEDSFKDVSKYNVEITDVENHYVFILRPKPYTRDYTGEIGSSADDVSHYPIMYYFVRKLTYQIDAKWFGKLK